MFRLVILAGLLASVQCGALLSKALTDKRIVGGDIIRIEDVPYQVSVQKSGTHTCGGALISDRFVLSAAHCFNKWSTYPLKVRIGSSLKNAGGRLVEVSEIIQHELFDRATTDYDFALLKLGDFNKTRLIWGAVKLPNQNQGIEDGAMCTVSGWGRTQSSNPYPDSLRAVDVPVVSQEYCIGVYRNFGYEVTDRMVCAGYLEGGKDACQGDSGGPLVSKDTLVGVVSWGFGCAQPRYPGVYSRVSSVRDWIQKKSGI